MHVVLLIKVYAPYNAGVFQTFYVYKNYSLQYNSLHEMALLPKWSIIYTTLGVSEEWSPVLSEGFL